MRIGASALLLLAATAHAARLSPAFAPATARLTAAAAGLRLAPKCGVLGQNMCLRMSGGSGGIQSIVSREV